MIWGNAINNKNYKPMKYIIDNIPDKIIIYEAASPLVPFPINAFYLSSTYIASTIYYFLEL